MMAFIQYLIMMSRTISTVGQRLTNVQQVEAAAKRLLAEGLQRRFSRHI